jgi:hypothetical protein
MNFDEHVTLGYELKKIRQLLVNAAHGRNRKHFDRIWKGIREIDQLRSFMEDRFCIEYPKEFSTKVYYGGPLVGDTCDDQKL